MEANNSLIKEMIKEVDSVVTAEELLGFAAEDEARFAGLNDSVCTYDEVSFEAKKRIFKFLIFFL